MAMMKSEPISNQAAADDMLARIAIDTDWNAVAPASIVKLANACADGLGTSTESFFFPLLTATAAVLGQNAVISLNDLWPEPPIIWTAVIADDTCRKKSSVVRFLARSMKEADDHIRREHAEQVFTVSDTNATDPPPSLVQNLSEFEFSVRNLKDKITSGSRQACIIAKDLNKIYRALDAKPGNGAHHASHEDPGLQVEREAFFQLQTGCSPWSDVTGSVSEDARFNLTGFIDPQHAANLLTNHHLSNSAGFIDTTVAIIYPKPRKVYHNPSRDSSSNALSPIFVKLRQNHATPKVYTLDAQANAAFSSYHNDVEERLDRMTNEDITLRRILSKSQGQVARLALVLHCLEHVTRSILQKDADVITEPIDENIPLEIPAGVMYNAINLIQLCIRHKRGLIIKDPSAAKTPEVTLPVGSLQGQSSQMQSSARADSTWQRQQVQQHRQVQQQQVQQQQQELQLHLQQQQKQLQQHLQQHQQQQELTILNEAVRSAETLSVQHPELVSPVNNVSPVVGQQRRMMKQAGSSNQMLSPSQEVQQGTVQGTSSMSSGVLPDQNPPFPVGISVVPNGPQIVQVTYTPEGSNTPVSAQSQARNPAMVPLSSLSGRPAIKSKPSLQRLNRFSVPPRPKSNSVHGGKVLPRPSSKLSVGAMKILKRAQKRNHSPAPAQAFPNSCPTSADFRNFVVQCPLKARRVLTHGSNRIDAIYVAQRKLFPPVVCQGPDGKKIVKYPTNAARAFLAALADAGLGDMIARVGSRSGQSTFKKKPYNELSPSALAILGRLNVTEQQYTYVDNTIFS